MRFVGNHLFDYTVSHLTAPISMLSYPVYKHDVRMEVELHAFLIPAVSRGEW